MQECSDEFLELSHKSHTVAYKVEVIDTNIGTDYTYELDCAVSGTVTVDRTAPIRRRANLTLVDRTGEWTPNDANDLLAPYGNYIRIWRGVYLSDGSAELKPLATARISRMVAEETADGLTIQLDAYSRFRYISRNRFTKAYAVLKGVNYTDAIHDMLISRNPDIEGLLDLATTNYTAPKMVFDEQSDPVDALVKMAGSIGMVIYDDPMGYVVMKKAPSIHDPAVFDFAEGDDCTVTDMAHDLDDEGGYNGVVEESTPSNSTTTFRGEAWDDNPHSPTYYLGPYEPCPLFHSSQMFTSNDQCQDAAQARLSTLVGSVEGNKLTAVPMEALEPGDIATVGRVKVGVLNELHFIDAFTIPLGSDGLMDMQTRKVGESDW